MSPAVCSRWQITLPELPESGACPSCGSRLAVETPRTIGTEAGTLTLAPSEIHYGLGAILYECLTRQPPFTGDTRQSSLMKVLTAELVPPSALRAEIPADLEAVCLKCLAKAPGAPYATAEEVAADLQRFLNDEATLARPRLQSLGRKFGKSRRRASESAGTTRTKVGNRKFRQDRRVQQTSGVAPLGAREDGFARHAGRLDGVPIVVADPAS